MVLVGGHLIDEDINDAEALQERMYTMSDSRPIQSCLNKPNGHSLQDLATNLQTAVNQLRASDGDYYNIAALAIPRKVDGDSIAGSKTELLDFLN